MSKSKVREVHRSNLSPFDPDDEVYRPCAWDECQGERMDPFPVCGVHAYVIHREIERRLTPTAPKPVKPKRPVVYYLMIGPATVKIGTTSTLLGRLKNLRTDIQYVVAIEPGSFDLEAQRHRQFAAERIGRREDFRVSDALKAHIAHLQERTYSDELLEMYRSLAARMVHMTPAERENCA